MTPGGARFSRDEVVAGLEALGVARILEQHGIKVRRSGRELRFGTCPTCGLRARVDAVAANIDSGRWLCHAHGCKGSLLDLAARLAGIDPTQDFPRALAAAAEVAGIEIANTASHQERERRRAEIMMERAKASEKAKEIETANAREAILRAGVTWAAARRRSVRGETYLASRGLGTLAGHEDQIRFGHAGDIAVALRGLRAPHEVVNVVRRRLPPAEPKVVGLKGCPTLGVFGNVGELEVTGGHVVLVEGVFDYLTAAMLYRPQRNLVLGVHGGSNLPRVAAALAPRLRLLGRRFLFVPHEDGAGERVVDGAINAAIATGLPFDPEIDLVNLGGSAKDLNEALLMGAGDVRDLI